MSQLKVDLLDAVSIAMALTILNSISSGTPIAAVTPGVTTAAVETVVEPEVDELGDLMGGEPEIPATPTVDDMKQSLQGMIDNKGRDEALALVKRVFTKLGVKKMDEIPDDKRQAFCTILNTAAAK